MSLDAVVLNEVKKLQAQIAASGGGIPVNTLQAFPDRGAKFTDVDGGEWLRTGELLDDTAGNYPQANKHMAVTGVGEQELLGVLSTYSSDIRVAFDITDGQVTSISSNAYHTVRTNSRLNFNIKGGGADLTEGLTQLTGNPYYCSPAYDSKRKRFVASMYDSANRALCAYDEFWNLVFAREESTPSSVPRGSDFCYDPYLDCFWEEQNTTTSGTFAMHQWTPGFQPIGKVDVYDNNVIENAHHVAINKEEFLTANTYKLFIQSKTDLTVYTEVKDLQSDGYGAIRGMFEKEGYVYLSRYESSTTRLVRLPLEYTATNFIGIEMPKHDVNGLPLYTKIK